MRRWLVVLAVGSLAVLAVGVVQILRSHGDSLDAALRKLEPGRPWYLGRSFESLGISRIQRGDGVLVFTYGNCKKRCVQVQEQALAGHNPVAYLRKRKRLPCTRTTVRGAPAARFEGLEVYTGRRTVSLFARTLAEERRMGAALRRLGGPTPKRLPPPALDLERGLAACTQGA